MMNTFQVQQTHSQTFRSKEKAQNNWFPPFPPATLDMLTYLNQIELYLTVGKTKYHVIKKKYVKKKL